MERPFLILNDFSFSFKPKCRFLSSNTKPNLGENRKQELMNYNDIRVAFRDKKAVGEAASKVFTQIVGGLVSQAVGEVVSKVFS